MPGGHRPKLATHVRQKITQSPFQNSKTAIVNDNVLSGMTGHLVICTGARRKDGTDLNSIDTLDLNETQKLIPTSESTIYKHRERLEQRN